MKFKKNSEIFKIPPKIPPGAAYLQKRPPEAPLGVSSGEMNGGRLTGDFAAFEVVAESHGESRSTDGDLQRRDVVGRHVIFATSFVFVVDDVLADVAVDVLLAVEELNLTFKYFVDFSMTRNGFLCYEPIRAHFE